MIQRIQTIWLLLAALIFAALFIFPVYEYVLPQGFAGGTKNYLGAKMYFPLLVVTVFLVLLPLIGIFLFKNRKKQKSVIWLTLLTAITFIALMLIKIANIRNGKPAPSIDSYSIPGALLPVIGVFLLLMAVRGINKDEKLVRSMDRLR